MPNRASLKPAEQFLEFVNASPTPFHAVHEAKQRLEKAGFKKIRVYNTLVPDNPTAIPMLIERPPRNEILGPRTSAPAENTT
ncbi:hypothetical protein LTR28_000900 [Elasticomyces elasticus]|nr:hypothetical protein LTR28_000900 [Elasticomyces elasticus]